MAEALRWLGKADRFARLRRIESLDLETEFREITALFSEDFRSVMLPVGLAGFLMTYAIPRMSRILESTGQLERHFAKRMIDTALLARAVMEHGLAPGPGRDAARRVNMMHSRYDLHDDDFVGVACDTIIVTLGLADRFGWRPVTDKEREAVRLFHAQQARAFGSRKPFPATLALVEAFWAEYAERQIRFEPQNLRLANVALDWFGGLVPRPFRPLLRRVLLSTIDERILRGCGLRPPSRVTRWVADAALRRMGRRDPVPDGAPDGMEAMTRTVYPDGYEISELGTHLKPRMPADPQPAMSAA